MKKAKTLILIYFLPLIVAGIVGGMLGSAFTYRFKPITPPSQPSSSDSKQQNKTDLGKLVVIPEESAVTDTVKKSSPAVVSIVQSKLSLSFSNFGQGVGIIGSGFLVNPGGTIITNTHVVNDPGTQYYVLLENKKVYPVQFIFRDTNSDIAIVQIYADNLPFLKLGDSNNIKSGQKVIAIGTILGQLNNTVSIGNISAVNRNITVGDSNGNSRETLSNIIQTDVAINPGNSGGPLLNLNGEVIGVNVAYTANASNIGFAIPSNTVKKILDSFNQSGQNKKSS